VTVAVHPRERQSQIGRDDLERDLARLLDAGALANGWLITGAEGAGKATLAYRIAKALLDAEGSRASRKTLAVDPGSSAARLVTSGAHPDLFVAEIDRDENFEPKASVITIDTIRKLIQFFAHTPAMSGWRVAIIDTADDLNVSARNALLKALEEPPARTCLLLLSHAPGRLPATLRSRCRRIDLGPVSQSEVIGLLRSEGITDDQQAAEIARASNGRPGYSLRIANAEGAQPIAAANEFLKAAQEGLDVAPIAARFAGKSNDESFALFVDHLLSLLADAARSAANANEGARAYEAAARREDIEALLRRGEALNLDRTLTLLSAARSIERLSAPWRTA